MNSTVLRLVLKLGEVADHYESCCQGLIPRVVRSDLDGLLAFETSALLAHVRYPDTGLREAAQIMASLHEGKVTAAVAARTARVIAQAIRRDALQDRFEACTGTTVPATVSDEEIARMVTDLERDGDRGFRALRGRRSDAYAS